MKIAFVAGGTLGSVSPLLAIANTLNRSDIIWIGTSDGVEKKYIEKLGIRYFQVPSYRLRRFFSISNITNIPRLFEAFSHASTLLDEQQIEFIIGAGSYVQVPVFFAASRKSIPSCLLQLDIQEGLANKICKRWAKIIFSATNHAIGHPNIKMIGIPVLATEDNHSFSYLTKSPLPTTLVIGGSTGSKWLNTFVLEKSRSLLQSMNIIHFQGNLERSIALPEIKAPGKYLTYTNAPLELVHDAMRVAQCAISRAGMGTIAELSYYGVPAILVPIPKSHQVANAQYCKDLGCADVFHQKEGFGALCQRAKELCANESERVHYMKNSALVFPKNALSRIREELDSI